MFRQDGFRPTHMRPAAAVEQATLAMSSARMGFFRRGNGDAVPAWHLRAYLQGDFPVSVPNDG